MNTDLSNTALNNTKPPRYSGAQVDPTIHDQSQSGIPMHSTLDSDRDPAHFRIGETRPAGVDSHAPNAAEQRTHAPGGLAGRDIYPSGGIQSTTRHGVSGDDDISHGHPRQAIHDQTQTSHTGISSGGRRHPTSSEQRTGFPNHNGHPSAGIQSGAPHGALGSNIGYGHTHDQTQTSSIDTHSAGRREPVATATTAATAAAGGPMGTNIHPRDHTYNASSGPGDAHPTAGGIDHHSTTGPIEQRKPTVGEKIKGNLEKVSGKMTDNPAKVAHGEQLAHSAKPVER
ncbi:hypothetical protein BX666DRAFT_1876553 [Dichotomocladium elegans]|nr:hypothetical protein BX666DRAFT_1876553 [Dichotomocladium elegans]